MLGIWVAVLDLPDVAVWPERGICLRFPWEQSFKEEVSAAGFSCASAAWS